jgi:hypothetical protein
VGDSEDPAHMGFECLLELIDTYHPKYLLHGHVHTRYGMNIQREREYHGTKVINVCEKFVLDIPKEEIGTWKKPKLSERVKMFIGPGEQRGNPAKYTISDIEYLISCSLENS